MNPIPTPAALSRWPLYWQAVRYELRSRVPVAVAGIPFVMILGIAAGAAGARAQGVPPGPTIRITLALFVLLLVASHVLDALASATLDVLERRAWQQLVSVAIDAAIGGRMGQVVAGLSGTDISAGVAVGAVMLPLYNLIVLKLALGGLGDAIGDFMLMRGGVKAAPGHSRADALAARGQFDEAVAALLAESAAPSGTADAATCMRIARMLRDSARRYEEASQWMRKAVADCHDPTLEAAAVRELSELYSHRLHSPERAAPYLARLASHQPNTPAGVWARRELEDIKRTIPQ